MKRSKNIKNFYSNKITKQNFNFCLWNKTIKLLKLQWNNIVIYLRDEKSIMNCIVVDYKWEITENNCLSVPLVSKKQLIGKKWMKYLNAAIYCTDENIQSCKFAFLRKIQVSNERNIHADQCTFSWCTMFNDHFILGQKSYDHDILKLQKGHSIISNT